MSETDTLLLRAWAKAEADQTYLRALAERQERYIARLAEMVRYHIEFLEEVLTRKRWSGYEELKREISRLKGVL